MEVIIMVSLLVLILALLGWAALVWGVNSNDDFNSPEWERRKHWPGFGGDGDAAL